MLAVRADARTAVLFRPRCKKWDCPACAEINKRLWTWRASNGAAKLLETGETLNMLTLTSHGRLNADQTIYVFRRAWPTLYKRARRKAGTLHYFMVPERHKDGRLHLHALSTANLGTRFWKDNGAQVGMGYMNEEEPCRDNKAAAAYVSKYVGKQLAGVNDWPPRFRRIRTSRNWPKMPDPERSPHWTFKTLLSETAAVEEEDRLKVRLFTQIQASHSEAWSIIESIDNALATD